MECVLLSASSTVVEEAGWDGKLVHENDIATVTNLNGKRFLLSYKVYEVASI